MESRPASVPLGAAGVAFLRGVALALGFVAVAVVEVTDAVVVLDLAMMVIPFVCVPVARGKCMQARSTAICRLYHTSAIHVDNVY